MCGRVMHGYADFYTFALYILYRSILYKDLDLDRPRLVLSSLQSSIARHEDNLRGGG